MKLTLVRNEFQLPLLALGACVAAVLVSGCGDDKKEEETKVEAKFTSIYKNVLSDCKKCHKPGTAQYTDEVKLDLSTQAAAYASLTGKMEITAKQECENGNYVNPGSPESSGLWAVLDNTTREAFATVITDCSIIAESEHGISVSSQAKKAIKEWITKGAAND